MDIRQRIFQYRSYTPIPFLILMAIFARPTIVTGVLGFAIMALGEFLRLWGVSIAGSETRTTGPVGGTYLITKGPFAYVRNPLYLGNMMLYTGVGIMANVWWLALAALLYFSIQYSLIVSLEEEYLKATYGSSYDAYCAAVRRFVPRLSPYDAGTHLQPGTDWKRGWISEKRTLQAIGAMTLLVAALGFIRG